MKTMTSPSVGHSWKFYILIGLICFLVLFAADAFAGGGGVGLAKYNTETLDPQAKAGFTLIQYIAIVVGGVFMLIGFMKLGGQQGKGQAIVLIIVGGSLTSIPFFMQITGETVSGKELNSKTQEIINQQ